MTGFSGGFISAELHLPHTNFAFGTALVEVFVVHNHGRVHVGLLLLFRRFYLDSLADASQYDEKQAKIAQVALRDSG